MVVVEVVAVVEVVFVVVVVGELFAVVVAALGEFDVDDEVDEAAVCAATLMAVLAVPIGCGDFDRTRLSACLLAEDAGGGDRDLTAASGPAGRGTGGGAVPGGRDLDNVDADGALAAVDDDAAGVTMMPPGAVGSGRRGAWRVGAADLRSASFGTEGNSARRESVGALLVAALPRPSESKTSSKTSRRRSRRACQTSSFSTENPRFAS